MKSYEELLEKAKEWREWYYDGEPELDPVAQPVKEAFDLINATLFGHIYQRPELDTKIRSLCTIAALTVPFFFYKLNMIHLFLFWFSTFKNFIFVRI